MSQKRARHRKHSSDLPKYFLSEQQISQYREIFSFLDQDRDGCISVSELYRAVHSIDAHISLQEVQMMIRGVNGHGDYITGNEFLILMGRKHLNDKTQRDEGFVVCSLVALVFL
eukprot:TRINITY_DN2565_c0_g1_i2.p1 TRINITY_DN2565_c0_g1~~TRINITY_DN2565_c0_g1_i2.p1  ORF type:complete len:114 (+),score=7.27 TRINITY_DN2565_c0_g1_i2:67-408(+)